MRQGTFPPCTAERDGITTSPVGMVNLTESDNPGKRGATNPIAARLQCPRSLATRARRRAAGRQGGTPADE